MTHIHIGRVENLFIGGGSECFPASAPPPARNMGRVELLTQTPGTPPMQMLRAALHKPGVHPKGRTCPTCGDKKQITRNLPDFPGDFEMAPCPTCSRERRAE